MNFENQRYITMGVDQFVHPTLQVFMWHCVDEMNEPKDYLQVFKLAADEENIKTAFYKAKKMLRSGALKNRKAIVEKYIKQVTVYEDKIEIEFSLSDSYSFKEIVNRK